MGQIIKQPNGKYCIFSIIVDDITHYNLTQSDIVELRVEKAKKSIEKEVKEIVDKLEKGEKPYNHFTKSFDEAMNTIGNIHGEEEKQNMEQLINN